MNGEQASARIREHMEQRCERLDDYEFWDEGLRGKPLAVRASGMMHGVKDYGALISESINIVDPITGDTFVFKPFAFAGSREHGVQITYRWQSG